MTVMLYPTPLVLRAFMNPNLSMDELKLVDTPCFASYTGPKTKPRPDVQLIYDMLLSTLELKTQNALPPEGLDLVCQIAGMMKTGSSVAPLPFGWPTPDSTEPMNTPAKVMVQVRKYTSLCGWIDLRI